jgi:hypothetical protein
VKNKLFFFANYEALRERARDQVTGNTPTDLERRGDFSQSRQLVGGNCVPVQVFDPLTTRANPAGGFLREAFPGNAIPTARQNIVGVKVAGYFPQPNTAGAACTNLNNFFSNKTTAIDTNEIDAKADWVPSEKNKLTLGLGWRTRIDTPPNHYGNAADTRIIKGDHMPARSARLEFNRTQTPTFLLQARFGVTRLERYYGTNSPEGFALTDLGFPAGLDAQMIHPLGFPVMSFTGYLGMGKASQFLDQRGTSYMWVANATKIKGSHQIKFGVEYRINQSLEGVGTDTSGNFSFDRAFTQGPNPQAPASTAGIRSPACCWARPHRARPGCCPPC